jgi:transcriptional regulator with XRE-family HTH domain
MRNKIRYSGERVSKLLKISPKTVQNHEKDKRRPNQPTLEGYASLYGCSWEWLLTGKMTYRQEEEHMLPREGFEVPDSGPGQLRLPDMSEYRIVKVVEPEEGQWQRLHVKLDQILAHLARQEKRLKELEKKAGIELPGNEAEPRKEHRSPSSKPR